MTSPERYQRVKSLFVAALELDPAERPRFLASECLEARDVRDEVVALLADHDRTSPILDTKQQESIAVDASKMIRPERIGPYRIVQELGQGGMGVVYLAEQERPVHRLVALKVIKPGMASQVVLARFEAEQQALAMMDHPAVARVFDAGLTPEGRPFFSMEYVEGVPVVQYCDDRRLTLPQRLELFVQICRGVQHAHQKGIIHRDLKPSNVLVAEQDGKPAPKIIDFGVAKAMEQRLTQQSFFTEVGQLVGTPEYMSPEQAGLTPSDVDTRTDIYSLGMLLYESLTGTTPFDLKSLRAAGLAEFQRTIREVDPVKPSTRLSALGADTAVVAQNRQTDVRTLSRQLRGDLDCIVMKCLEKERARRYESVSTLAADVERFLRNEPVSAGPPDFGYLFRKFVRRHRRSVAAAAAIMVTLIAGLAVSLTLYFRLLSSETLTRKHLRRADAVTRMLVATFQGIKPSVALGRDPTMLREMMDESVKNIERGELAENPEAEHQLRRLFGEAYREVSDVEAAKTMFERAERLARAMYGSEHHEVALDLMSRANVLDRLGQHDLAMQLQEESLRIRQNHYGSRHADVAANLNNMAIIAKNQNRHQEAERMFREALEMNRRVLGPYHENVSISLGNLAALFLLQDKFDDAEQMLLEALRIRRINPNDDDQDAADVLFNLAQVYRWNGDLSESERRFVDALIIVENLSGKDDRKLLEILPDYAGVLEEGNKCYEAEPVHRRILDLRRKYFGDDDPKVAASCHNLGCLLYRAGNLEESRRFLLTALGIRRQKLPHQPETGFTLACLARTVAALGQLAGAETYVREGIELLEQTPLKQIWWTAVAQSTLGTILCAQAKYPESEIYVWNALMFIRSQSGMSRYERDECFSAVIRLYEQWGRQADLNASATR